MQRLQGEGRVPHPGEAVIPVALAAGGLGQRGGERGDGGAGWHVGEPLDRQRGALDRLAKAVVGHPRPRDPAPPVTHRGVKSRPGVIDVRRRLQAIGPGERAERLLALREDVARPHPVALDAEGDVGSQPDRQIRPRGIGGESVLADQRPLGRDTAVVEIRLADQLDLDASFEARGDPDQQVVGVVVGGRAGVRGDRVLAAARADRQRLANEDPAGRRVPGGGEDVRARLVGASRRHVDPERAESEAAGLAVEQGSEHARGVEARHAEPVHRSVGCHQRPGVAVGEKCVLSDRRKGRWRGRALRLTCSATRILRHVAPLRIDRPGLRIVHRGALAGIILIG